MTVILVIVDVFVAMILLAVLAVASNPNDNLSNYAPKSPQVKSEHGKYHEPEDFRNVFGGSHTKDD